MDYSLDVQLQASDAGQLVADVRKEMDQVLKKIGKCKSYGDRKGLYAELKALRKELRVREPQAVSQLIEHAQLVCTTLMSAGSHLLRHQHFDTVIIDEATQSLEPECWIAILKANRLILAGDPHQLPPTIMSPEAAKKGLSTTLFDRIQALYGTDTTHLLSIQYRMHPLIMEWSSQAMYGGKLESGPNVHDRLLCNLPHLKENEDTTPPLILVDTAGCGVHEIMEEDGESKYNDGEAVLAQRHCEALVQSGLSPADIAIITPYNAQVQHLRSLLPQEKYPALEIGSVDGFQASLLFVAPFHQN